MTPADLLDLRRRVARVLPEGLTWATLPGIDYERLRQGAALLERVEGEWLPVLTDDGTIGVLLGELVRRVAARGWQVVATAACPGWPAEVLVRDPDGTWDDAQACHVHGDLGITLALALVEVADAR